MPTAAVCRPVGQQVVSCMWLEIWLTDCKTANSTGVQVPHWPTKQRVKKLQA